MGKAGATVHIPFQIARNNNAGGERAMEDIPWNSEAVAVRQREGGHRGERIIVAQGTLATVINDIARRDVELDRTLVISLADRSAAPFQYDVCDIARLIAAKEVEPASAH